MKFFRLAVILFFCLDLFILRAADHYVVPTNAGASSPFADWGSAATNIQDAVNVAANGETVWLTNGTYFAPSNCVLDGAMVIITNSITVRSFSGSYTDTVVNGNWPACTTRVFLVNNTGAVVSGLTITNGYNYTNTVLLGGAGVYITHGGLLTNCLITGNIMSNNYVYLNGAAICLNTGVVSHCIIKGNRGGGDRGCASGIAAVNSAVGIISNCIFANNRSGGFGSQPACILSYPVALTMTWCNVYGTINGNGIAINGNGFVSHCVSSNNSYDGLSSGQEGAFRNCQSVNNGNDGIHVSQYGITLESCTIAGNAVWGIHVPERNPNPYYKFNIENNISYYNGAKGTNDWCSTNISYTNCCTYSNAPGLNNITNPPLFADTNNGNYRLSANSPCINAGTNKTWMTNSVDLDGNPRIRYGIVDIGAYEVIYKGTVYKF